MSKIKWLQSLGWSEDHLDDLRFAGYAYIRQGKYEIAVAFFEALCVLAPESAYDHQTLGALYVELGKPGKALKFLEMALKLDADHSPTLLNMCKALLMLGRKDEAIKLAGILQNEKNPTIANTAKALILAYS